MYYSHTNDINLQSLWLQGFMLIPLFGYIHKQMLQDHLIKE